MPSEQQSDYSVFVNNLFAFATAVIAFFALKGQEKQHLDSMEQIQSQYIDSQKRTQVQFAATIKATLDDLRLSHDPYLQFEREGVVFIEPSRSNGWQRAGLSNGKFTLEDYNSLPEVENLGRGPAFQVEFNWTMTSVNGEEISTPIQTSFPSERNLRGDEENIRVDWLPEQVTTDIKRNVEFINGRVHLRCRSLGGTSSMYSMDVRITTHYRESRPYVKFDFTGWECESCKVNPSLSIVDHSGPTILRPNNNVEAPEPPLAK